MPRFDDERLLSAADPRVGTTLGGYEIESLLGRGGMGVVYLARDSKLGRKVALKILAADLAEDEGFRSRFIRESQMAAATDHPNIIPVYDAGETDGVLFLAMRYVEGTDLRQVIKDHGALDPARAVSIVGQIGSALDAAHTSGLIHRDVKPANVLLATLGSSDEPLDHVYLTDFGLTKRSDSRSKLTETGGFMGTIDYMSPEQIEGKEVDHRTDLYALGCVFYECLTGTVPYERDSDVAVMYAHLMDERPLVSALRPEIPSEIDAVVSRAMNRDPKERYPSAAAMMGDARRAFGMSVSGEIPRPGSLPGKQIRHPAATAPTSSLRRRIVPAAVGALLLAGVAGYVLSRPEANAPSEAGARSPSTGEASGLAWVPSADSTLQLQLSGRLNTSYEADVYNVDLDDTPTSSIEELHGRDRKVACYISAGAWEDWRPDADSFPAEVLGKYLEGSENERWLDIRRLDVLEPIIAERVATCADKGFDAAVFDNVDGYGNDSGFGLKPADQAAYSEMLAELAHENGLAAGLTNSPELAAELEPSFDFAISTACFQFDECSLFERFVDADKPVFVIEFELGLDEFCERAEQGGFNAQRKRYNLGAWRQACWE